MKNQNTPEVKKDWNSKWTLQDFIKLDRPLYKMENKTITLWQEGYAATGERSGASCIGTYIAIDLDDAVKQHMELNPEVVDWDRFGRGRHAIWACEIFDNELVARESFG